MTNMEVTGCANPLRPVTLVIENVHPHLICADGGSTSYIIRSTKCSFLYIINYTQECMFHTLTRDSHYCHHYLFFRLLLPGAVSPFHYDVTTLHPLTQRIVRLPFTITSCLQSHHKAVP